MPNDLANAQSGLPTAERLPAGAARDWRPLAVVAGCLLFWFILAARLIHLQWAERSQLVARAENQRLLIQTIPARPGDIVDRQGRLLATTIESSSLYLVPSRIDDPKRVVDELNSRLAIDGEKLLSRLQRNRKKQFLWAARWLDRNGVEAVRELDWPPKIFGFRTEFRRRYPHGRLASQLIGLRDIDGEGRGGIEQSQDRKLRGREGKRKSLRDSRGRVVAVLDEIATAPRPGLTVQLTVDVLIQTFVERELDQLLSQWEPEAAAAIVLDPGSNDLLAMASRPTFDPNRPVGVPPAAWKNYAISSVYEPGSTFKPLVLAWAIDQRLVEPDETFDCEQGAYRMGPRILHDHHPYGELSVTDVLVKSSNIGMAKIGERLGIPQLYSATVGFGFGEKTGVPLPGEVSGIVRSEAEWNGYSIGSIPMGQELAVTPLQLINAHATLARGGVRRSPRLIHSYRDGDTGELISEVPQSTIVTRVLGREAAEWVVQEPMRAVVQRGSVRVADLPGQRVFGKTGTAQKIDPDTGRYSETDHICSFLCGAPAEDPRVLVLVVVDSPSVGGPHYGANVAAPAAAEILKHAVRQLPPAPTD